MPDDTNPSRGRFTTHFTSVAAGDVHVPGLRPGAAGSRAIGHSLLSSIAAIFHISPDTVPYVPPAPLSIALTPAARRPLPYLGVFDFADRSGELLSIGD